MYMHVQTKKDIYTYTHIYTSIYTYTHVYKYIYKYLYITYIKHTNNIYLYMYI